MDKAIVDSPLGSIELAGDVNGLTSAKILKQQAPPSSKVPDTLQLAREQLLEYFEGQRSEFTLQLHPQGTDFQKKVWQMLSTIPFGKTCSYLELSKKLGDVKAIRAVAAANGKNPLCIIIPCHRVIGSDGSLTGYAGGLHRKKWLLNHESPSRQQQLF